VADAIVAILDGPQMLGNGGKFEFFNMVYIRVLTQVAEYLDAPDALRVAEGVVLAMRKANELGPGTNELTAALAAVCRRLDADGSQRVAEAMIAAIRDPMCSWHSHYIFADACAIIAGHLAPAPAASLENALVDSLLVDLNNSKDHPSQRWAIMKVVGRALGMTCGRPGATRAAHVALALHSTIKDPQTPTQALEPLTAALMVVCAQLTPEEAASHRVRTLAVLDSLWNDLSAPRDRAEIAAALVLLWPHLDRTAAAARAQTAVTYLNGELRKTNLDAEDIPPFAFALSALYSFLEPAERCRQADSNVEALLAVRLDG
jgi:hypothetical protein